MTEYKFAIEVEDISKGLANIPIKGMFAGWKPGEGANVKVPIFDVECDEEYLCYAESATKVVGGSAKMALKELNDKGYKAKIIDLSSAH